MIKEVPMGGGIISRSPDVIVSQGLGSCVAVTIYDSRNKTGGLAHIMLPDSSGHESSDMPCQFVDTAIAYLLEGLEAGSSEKKYLVAKIVGGAQMFSMPDHTKPGVGAQNITAIKTLLQQEKIPIVGEDTGGHAGRSVEFHLEYGKLIVIKLGEKNRSI
ncbi:MAG: chemotaxis protein CheD [Methanoregula sp.]|nr:chemotaxis protein CheD [Methanoregula sp.]